VLANVLRKGFQMRFQIRVEGLLLATAYAATCWAARNISVDQFYLVAGIRVSALLLCPRRLWPYLILGEYAYLAHSVYPMMEKYGIAWAVVRSALLMPAAAAIVHLHLAFVRTTSAGWLVSLAAVVALALTLINVAMAQLLWPIPPATPALERVVRYSLGDFIGIMTVAPLALLWAQRGNVRWWRIENPISTVISVVSILLLGICAHWIPEEHSSFRTTLQLSMAVPAIVLTSVHGWQGAAVAVPLLNLVVGLTVPSSGQPWSFDSRTFAIQQVLAITGAALLVLGSCISHYYHRYSTGACASRRMMSMTRRSAEAGELALRERALDMNRVGEGIDIHLSETADWLKRQGHDAVAFNLIRTSSFYSRKFRAQASMVYPTALEHLGLYLALQVGGISDMWESTGRMARPRLIGDPCQLTVPLQLATYRTLTEAVSLLLKEEKGQIRVNARCGRLRNRRGILVVVAILDRRHRLHTSTVDQSIAKLTGRTLAYGGTVQCRRNRIRILLVDN